MSPTHTAAREHAPGGVDSIPIRHAVDILSRVPDAFLSEDLPRLLGAIEAAKARAWRRMGATTGTPTPEVFITVEEALALVPGIGRRTLLRLTWHLRFRRDLSRKTVRFERAGLLAWAHHERLDGLTADVPSAMDSKTPSASEDVVKTTMRFPALSGWKRGRPRSTTASIFRIWSDAVRHTLPRETEAPVNRRGRGGVFRAKNTDRQGVLRRASTWTIQYMVPGEKKSRRRPPGSPTRRRRRPCSRSGCRSYPRPPRWTGRRGHFVRRPNEDDRR